MTRRSTMLLMMGVLTSTFLGAPAEAAAPALRADLEPTSKGHLLRAEGTSVYRTRGQTLSVSMRAAVPDGTFFWVTVVPERNPAEPQVVGWLEVTSGVGSLVVPSPVSDPLELDVYDDTYALILSGVFE